MQLFANLRYVALDGTAVTDTGLAHLSDLTNLQTVQLAGTAVTDTGLARLSGLTNLKGLFIDRTPIERLRARHAAQQQRKKSNHGI